MIGNIYNKLKYIFRKHQLILKYTLTGISATSMDLGLLYYFKEYLDFWYLYSALFALLISYSLAFIVQKYWTFGDYSDNNIHGQFIRYTFTAVFCLSLNLVILYLLVEFVHIKYLLAQVISLCITGSLGFVINVRNVFSRMVVDKGVLIASGIFPPDIGGPAVHIKKLAEELSSRGIKVSVVTYSKTKEDYTDNVYDITRISSDLPTALRGLMYLVSLFVSSIKLPNIFAQDVTSTGLPAMIVRKILPHKKLFIRIGGDLLWEREVESGATKLGMIDYYKSGSHQKSRLFKIGRAVMSSSDLIIVPAEFLKDIYVKYYGISSDKITVIKNPIPIFEAHTSTAVKQSLNKEKTILFAGRFLKLKNIERLILAFISIYEEIKPAHLVLIGHGPEKEKYLEIINRSSIKDRVTIINTLSQEELFSEISIADLCVCPSLTEVNSNFTLECLSIGKPVLSTRHNGLSIKLPEEMLFSYDNQSELEDKIKSLLNSGYDTAGLKKLITAESAKSSWENVVAGYLRVFNF